MDGSNQKVLQILINIKNQGNELKAFQIWENKQISEQRGFYERRLGDMFDIFATVRKKWRHASLSVRDTLRNIMAIMNIKDFSQIVREKILKKSEDQWLEFINSYNFIWKDDIIVPLYRNVSYF